MDVLGTIGSVAPWRGGRGPVLAGLLLALAGWVATLVYVRGDRRDELVQAQSDNAFIASAFEEHARRILRTADTALTFLQRGMEEHGEVTADMRAFAVMTQRDLEAIQLAVADPQGNLIFSAVPLKGPVNVADRVHFAVHREHADTGLYIGRPVPTKDTGAWTFFVTRRINRPDGSFGGMVSIGLDPFYFGKVYGDLRIGKDPAGLLVGTDHVVRVRIDELAPRVGDDISGYSPVFREAAQRPVGHYEVTSVLDGTRRLASYRVMPDYPLIVIASAIEEQALGAWRARRLVALLVSLTFTLLMAGASVLVSRARAQAQHREAEARILQDRLAQSQKLEAIGSLAGGVAHDFNNMLGVILGSVDLALAERPSSDMQRECLEEIREAAQRSASVTRQLLAFARKQPVAPRTLDPNRQVEDFLQMARRLIGPPVELHWSPGPGVWRVRIDPSQLDQVLTNLVTNGRDAIPGAGRVSLATGNTLVDQATCARHPGAAPGEYVVLSVSDTGSGIDPRHLEAIFEPFFTTKPKGRGTGLGLATVFGIVKQNGGFVEVESQLGRGSTFRVHLPRAVEAAGAEPSPAGARAPDGRGSETVLLVEDERAHLALVRRMLESSGYRVLAAADPLEALRLSEQEGGPIDLLLTDVMMPHLNGRQLHEALLERRSGLRCVYMSGFPADVLDHQGGLDPRHPYLQKPFTLQELRAQVRAALEA